MTFETITHGLLDLITGGRRRSPAPPPLPDDPSDPSSTYAQVFGHPFPAPAELKKLLDDQIADNRRMFPPPTRKHRKAR